LGTYASFIPIFLHILKLVTHVLYHKIHPLHHLCQGLNLEVYITLERELRVIIIQHDYISKNWLVV
jgi:hypothetical protein